MVYLFILAVSIIGMALFVREWFKWENTTGRDLDMHIAYYGSLAMMDDEELEEWQSADDLATKPISKNGDVKL